MLNTWGVTVGCAAMLWGRRPRSLSLPHPFLRESCRGQASLQADFTSMLNKISMVVVQNPNER